MMLNKILIQWFSFNVTTRSLKILSHPSAVPSLTQPQVANQQKNYITEILSHMCDLRFDGKTDPRTMNY